MTMHVHEARKLVRGDIVRVRLGGAGYTRSVREIEVHADGRVRLIPEYGPLFEVYARDLTRFQGGEGGLSQ